MRRPRPRARPIPSVVRQGAGQESARHGAPPAIPPTLTVQRSEAAGAAVREVLAYESVLESGLQNLSPLEEKDLKSRANDKRSSLATSVATAYRWVFYPEASGLARAPLAVPATAGEKIAQRAADRLIEPGLR